MLNLANWFFEEAADINVNVCATRPFERRLRLCDPEVATVNSSWKLSVGSSSKEKPRSQGLPNALARVYNLNMGKHVIHISEEEAAMTNVATLLVHVRAGAEVIIENGMRPVAVLHPAEPVPRTISECIALLPEDSTATIDPDFARDVAAAARGHREPLNPPTWD